MKKRSAKVTSKVKTRAGIMQNQFFGMLLLAIGIGALVVLVRYIIVATQMPLDVYEITPSLLIPGQQ